MTRVVVLTDDILYREGIESILRADKHIALVEHQPNLFTPQVDVDVALLDITTENSQATLANVRRCAQPPKVVAISVYSNPREILGWIELGCSACLPRSATSSVLLQTVRDTHRCELALEPQVVYAMVNRLASLAEGMAHHHALFAALTTREKEILNLVGQGLPNKAIASRLGISYATAKNHVHHILDKLHLHRRREAALYAKAPEKGLPESVR
jgi:DNA-binding NarL/FixJ family response regulator